MICFAKQFHDLNGLTGGEWGTCVTHTTYLVSFVTLFNKKKKKHYLSNIKKKKNIYI